MALRELLLIVCAAGGIAGIGAGAARKDISMALLGLIVVSICVAAIV